MRQQTLIINGFSNLRISKRERKINKTDPLNNETKTVDPLDTSNTGVDPGLGEEAGSSGSSGCTATPDKY